MRVVRANVFRRDESGQGLLEYALILLFIAAACLASLNYFGHKTNNTLSNSANTVGSALS
jgi:Flp pilus assembly pilin Flp